MEWGFILAGLRVGTPTRALARALIERSFYPET